jgi:hypothetical protein
VILILSHRADAHAMSVLAALDALGSAARMIDTADFPSRASLRHWFEGGEQRTEFSTDGRSVDLGTAGVGWWRRPQPFTLEPGIDSDTVSFAYTECYEAVTGLWAALDIPWVNPPADDEAAHHKPYQLAVAARAGLKIPRTLITNDPDAARRFIAEQGSDRTVYKTFLASEQHWRETRIVRPAELHLLDHVRLAPVIFQEYVPGVADIRVTVVGPKLFAAAITPAPGGYQVDYRMDLEGARFEATTLPPATEERIGSLMGRLGLVYGAVDLRRTPEGEHVFLEVNPAGEWRFVEERTGQPITQAVADLLTQLDARGLGFGIHRGGTHAIPFRAGRDSPAQQRTPRQGRADRGAGGRRVESGRAIDGGR